MIAAVLASVVLVDPPAAANSTPISPEPLGVVNVAGGVSTPTVLAWDSFQRADAQLAGSTLPSGQTWRTTIALNNWQLTGNQVRSSAASTIGYVVVQMNRQDAVAEVVLSNLTSGANAGIDINDDDTDNLMVLYTRSGTSSAVTLYKYISKYVQIGASVAVPGAPASVTLRVASVGAVISVWVDGILVMTNTLAGADLAVKYTNGDNTLFGLWSRNDVTTRFDNFHVDAP